MRWLRVFAIFTLVALLFVSQVWIDYAYSGHRLSWPRATAIALAQWWVWVPIVPGVRWLGTRFPFAHGRMLRALAVHLPASFLCVFLTIAIGAVAARSITGVVRAPFSFLRVHLNLFTYGAIVAAGHFIDQQRQARERDLRASRLQAQLAEAQLQALRMKLHPHFLFNTLNAIAALMREDVEAADVMIARLSDLLRIALETAEVQEVPLRRELELLEVYLDIERARAGERLVTRIAPEPETLDALVPTLILQPLVENAIRHGAYARPGAARVEVTSRLEGDSLAIEVRDDGPGPPPEASHGQGLSNTAARLATLYGKTASLTLERRPEGGAVARVILPRRVAREDATHWTEA